MPQIILAFSSAATIEHKVAGIPAGARALHALTALPRGDTADGCGLTVGSDWAPSGHFLLECERLASNLPIAFLPSAHVVGSMVIRGEAFVATLARSAVPLSRDAVLLALAENRIRRVVVNRTSCDSAHLRMLDRAAREILAATGKAGDGIFSRHVNRPISRAISGRLLRVPGIDPSHASAGTALLGIAMFLALLLGGPTGLVAGAILFQAASIFDGVDGEMARATHRTSREGASLDSVIDACTNLAFVMGVAINIGLAGDLLGAAAGGTALVILAVGLLLIGRRSRIAGDAVNFDVIKGQLRKAGKRSILVEGLIQLTMRDFYAAACAVLIVVGMTHFVMLAFATVTTGWFCVTLASLSRTSKRRRCEAVADDWREPCIAARGNAGREARPELSFARNR